MTRAVLVCWLLLMPYLAPGQILTDTSAFRAAMGLENPSARISALLEFVNGYPASPFRAGAWSTLFTLYVERKDERGALDAAAHALALTPEEGRMSPYNQFAYALAVGDLGLDSAQVYAERAEAMAQGGGPGMLGPIQDTRAYVLYRRGDPAGAETLQKKAIVGHEDDPEYIAHLAVYQEANGRRRQALATMARGIFNGGDREMDSGFFTWLSREEKDPRRRDALKTSVVMNVVHAALDTLHGAPALAGGSNAAAFMARLSVDLPAAQRYAERAVKSLTRHSPAEQEVTFKQNLALVLAARGKSREALAMLESIEGLASPWATDFWIALGGLHRKVGNAEGAINAYMNGLAAVNPPQLRDTLEALYRTVHGSTAGLDAELERVRKSGASFDPGRYAPGAHPTGKVILAELFTGAECGPCVAADIAFDGLREHFPPSALAILEYHVHVPGADPLTTNDSWARYKLYGARGTPTVVIDGQENILGGGPKFVARNRFNLYRYAIGRSLEDAPALALDIDVARRHDSVTVAARVRSARPESGERVLHVALVERSVDYTGGNGIARQAMVVRGLLGGSEGVPLSGARTDQTVSVTGDIAQLESTIRGLLADPKSQPSWPNRIRPFTGWRARPEKIDRANLLVVAWVQNNSTHAVLQAATRDLPSGMSAR